VILEIDFKIRLLASIGLGPLMGVGVLGFVTEVGRIVQEISRLNGYGRMLNKGFYPRCLFSDTTGVYRGIRPCDKHRDRCGDPQEDQDVVLYFTYSPVSTVSLIFL